MYTTEHTARKHDSMALFAHATRNQESASKERKLAALDELSRLLTPEEWERFHRNIENARNRKA